MDSGRLRIFGGAGYAQRKRRASWNRASSAAFHSPDPDRSDPSDRSDRAEASMRSREASSASTTSGSENDRFASSRSPIRRSISACITSALPKQSCHDPAGGELTHHREQIARHSPASEP